MAQAARDEGVENPRIVLGLLESVERDGAKSQRKLASDLGIALGLVNAYLKRCVKKGLLKVSEAPAHRYVYYLTPHGFAEKSKLTVEYLSYSFSFFRQARIDCAEVLAAAKSRGIDRVVLAGQSDLADIVRICALECGVQIAAIVDAEIGASHVGDIPVKKSFADLKGDFDAIVVTDLRNREETFAAAALRLGADKVYVPKLLGLTKHEMQS
jgi:DNA-binding MarR family transcriptional regulator